MVGRSILHGFGAPVRGLCGVGGVSGVRESERVSESE